MEFLLTIKLLLYTSFLVIFLYKISKWLFDYLYKLSVVNKLKGLQIIPFIGNAHQLERKHKFFDQIIEVSKMYEKEPLFRFWVGWHPCVVFHKADNLDIIFSGLKHTKKSFEYSFLEPWLGTGLLTSYGEKWQFRRRLLTPTFHFDILNDFLGVMNEQAEILTSKLTELVRTGEDIDIFKRIKLCTLDIICETAMGQNVDAQNKQNSDYISAVSTISEAIFERFCTPISWMDLIYDQTKLGKEHKRSLKILHDFTRKVILKRNEEFEEINFKTQKRIAFLDMLLKAKHEDSTISFDDIQEEVDTFMFEGHDTTATALSWACQMIGSNPDVQKRLQDEIDSVFGDSDRHVTNEDLKRLDYLEQVIKETLRLFPPVPFFGRTLTEDDTVAGFKILKGSTAVIFTYMVHRDQKYYPEPERFNPDRFLPENTKDRHPYAFIPFSAGRRNCIGQRFALMEEKVVLAHILRKFEIKSIKTVNELKPIAEIILRPMQGIPIELIARK